MISYFVQLSLIINGASFCLHYINYMDNEDFSKLIVNTLPQLVCSILVIILNKKGDK